MNYKHFFESFNLFLDGSAQSVIEQVFNEKNDQKKGKYKYDLIVISPTTGYLGNVSLWDFPDIPVKTAYDNDLRINIDVGFVLNGKEKYLLVGNAFKFLVNKDLTNSIDYYIDCYLEYLSKKFISGE